ncbi:hypothetical protein [Lactovum odontotermitis]
MHTKVLQHFKAFFIFYIILGIAHTLLNSLNIFYFQKLLNEFTKGMSLQFILIYGVTLLLPLIISYISEYPENKLATAFTTS